MQVLSALQRELKGGTIVGRAVRFGLMGCGGLVVLIVVVAVLAIALGGGGDTDSPSTPQQPGSPGESEQAQAVAIGQNVIVGDVAWQVISAKQATELSSEFGTSRQGNFVIVDFNFTNNADEPATLDSASVALYDDEGRKSEADPDAYEFIDPNKDIFLNNVNPGVTDQGQVIFTVAPDASGFELEVGDADLFSDEAARVKLGF